MILWYIFISVKGSTSTSIGVYHYVNINDWSWKEISNEHSYNSFQITNIVLFFLEKGSWSRAVDSDLHTPRLQMKLNPWPNK